MTLHFMRDKELARLQVLRDLASGCLTVSAASELLGLERRQVLRLSKAYQEQGATALISRRRGRVSNRRTSPSVKGQALELIRERYSDFGPTLAAEKLRELHEIFIGRETLRIWMLEAGVWKDRHKRSGRVHQPRYRRERVGELVQVDGSEHWWFEDRGPQCTLLVFIDDATIVSRPSRPHLDPQRRAALVRSCGFVVDGHERRVRPRCRYPPRRRLKPLPSRTSPTQAIFPVMRDLQKPPATDRHLFDRLEQKLSQRGLVDIKLYAVGADRLSADQLVKDLLTTMEKMEAARPATASLSEQIGDLGSLE